MLGEMKLERGAKLIDQLGGGAELVAAHLGDG
jgi:hypothetical protein